MRVIMFAHACRHFWDNFGHAIDVIRSCAKAFVVRACIYFFVRNFCIEKYVFCCCLFIDKMTSRAVVVADDAKLVKAHREFNKWKKKNPVSGTLRATDFTFALKHFDKFRRAITKNIPSFKSRKTCARAMVMVTTHIGKKNLLESKGGRGVETIRT